MLELTACPECGLSAEILRHDWIDSTDGPVEHVSVQCVDRHRFYLPISHVLAAEGWASTRCPASEATDPDSVDARH